MLTTPTRCRRVVLLLLPPRGSFSSQLSRRERSILLLLLLLLLLMWDLLLRHRCLERPRVGVDSLWVLIGTSGCSVVVVAAPTVVLR